MVVAAGDTLLAEDGRLLFFVSPALAGIAAVRTRPQVQLVGICFQIDGCRPVGSDGNWAVGPSRLVLIIHLG